MKNFNILAVHWKIWILGGGRFTKKSILRRDCLKGGLEQFADLRGGGLGWQERGGGVFEGEWYPNAHYEDPIHICNFDIDHPVTISNFPQKLAKNQYICVGTNNISSLSYISSALVFRTTLRTTAEVNCLIFKIPCKKVIVIILYQQKSLNLPEKLAGNHYICEQF